jgi:hypothetical protein
VLNEPISGYGWADDYSTRGIESWTVAIIEGSTPEGVISTYGGDPHRSIGHFTFLPNALTFKESHGVGLNSPSIRASIFTYRSSPAAATSSHWRTTAIPATCPKLPAAAQRAAVGSFLSTGAPAANPRIAAAIDGRVTSYVEIYAANSPYVGEPAPSWIIDLTVELEHLRSTALALLEQQTGLSFNQHWLKDRRPTIRFPTPT